MFICRYQFRSSAEKRKIVFEEFMSRVAGNCELHSIIVHLQFSEEIALTNFPTTRPRDLTELECAKIQSRKFCIKEKLSFFRFFNENFFIFDKLNFTAKNALYLLIFSKLSNKCQ